MDKCKHGFDHACLICGFTRIDGKKVWFDWAWQEQQKRIDELQQKYDELNDRASQIAWDQMTTAKLNSELQARIDDYKKLTISIRNEFDLWSDDSDFADVIEAQIENLEALKGGEV